MDDANEIQNQDDETEPTAAEQSGGAHLPAPDVTGAAPPDAGGDSAAAEAPVTDDPAPTARADADADAAPSARGADEDAADRAPAPTDADAAGAVAVAEGPSSGTAARASSAPSTGHPEAEGMTMQDLLMEEGGFFPGTFQRGDVVEGIVVRKDKHQLVLDIGAKQEGIVPGDDLLRMPDGFIDEVKVGDKVKGIIMRPEGEVIVSIYRALTMNDWDDARALLDSGEIREMEIVGFNKGGALVGFGNLQAFVPRSQLSEMHAGSSDDENAKRLLGTRIPVKVIEVSRRKGRLIASERQALREWRSGRKRELLETLQVGDVRRGRISSVAEFGAFVDLGGADGLVHVSEMSHERGKHPKDIVQVGDEVEVVVLSIDRNHSRIGLSMKRLRPDPWASVEQEHYVGELMEATISNLAKFGAFARLDDGLEGLIHISELSDEHVEHPREAIKPGQRVTVEIISIDPRRQRVGLSIRRVPPHLRHVHDEAADEPPAPSGAAGDAGAGDAPDTDATMHDADAAPHDADTAAQAGDAPVTDA